MTAMTVRHITGDRFDIDIRSHHLTVDQPVDAGGTDTAPTPTELFVAGLTSCIAFYARRYLRRHELSAEGLVVTGDYAMTTKPARVSDVTVQITLPSGFPADRVEALLAVASHCTVHNSLRDEPAVSITAGIAEPAR
jgi:uncharacterized OsmC-like protein